MKIIETIMTLIVVAVVAVALWFVIWSGNFTQDMSIVDNAKMQWATCVEGMSDTEYVVHEFVDHVFEVIGMD